MAVQFLSATSDAYTDACTLGPSQQITSVTFSVSSPNSALFQVAKLGKDGIPFWDENELTAQPGQGSYENIYGIRFRSYPETTGTSVLAIAYFKDDPTALGFTPGTGVFSGGSVAPGTSGTLLAHALIVSSQSYTPPSGTGTLLLLAIGGGGGGGGGGSSWGGGGGGSGAWETLLSAAPLATPLMITIGAAGSAGTSGNSGGNGGTTKIVNANGSTILQIQGGFGGAGSSGSYGGKGGNGGSANGPSVIGDYGGQGDAGGIGAPSGSIGGKGGSSRLAGGGLGGDAAAGSVGANGSGGGGGGGVNSGGAGGAGVVEIQAYG